MDTQHANDVGWSSYLLDYGVQNRNVYTYHPLSSGDASVSVAAGVVSVAGRQQQRSSKVASVAEGLSTDSEDIMKRSGENRDSFVTDSKRFRAENLTVGNVRCSRRERSEASRLPKRDRKLSDHNRKACRAFPTTAPQHRTFPTIFKMAARSGSSGQQKTESKTGHRAANGKCAVLPMDLSTTLAEDFSLLKHGTPGLTSHLKDDNPYQLAWSPALLALACSPRSTSTLPTVGGVADLGCTTGLQATFQ
ncbi:hypothetical protein Bbelb_442650 [Branchiostoma belcheri]|nr:hypothetical protein Bbelb_442650 [Branchiostoma belcheri]